MRVQICHISLEFLEFTKLFIHIYPKFEQYCAFNSETSEKYSTVMVIVSGPFFGNKFQDFGISTPLCEKFQIWIKLTLCLLVSSADSQITFANRLDSDQAQQNVGPDLDPNCLAR